MATVESQVLADDPTFPAPWRALTNLGWAQFKLGETVEARATLEDAHDLNRAYWPTLLDLGILEHQEGRRLEAIERFQQLLELRPGPSATAETNYRLAEIYISLGKRERAVGHLLVAVTKAPEGRWGKKSEEYLKLLR
jgi:tetratricopeptide (TPR) repeat protein